MKTIGMLIFLVLASGVALADDAKDAPKSPQSPAAVGAMKDYQKAADDADAACRAIKVAACKKLVSKLTVARTVATKAGNLAEALAIDNQIKEANDRLAELSAAHSSSSDSAEKVVVPANTTGVNVGRVHKGDAIQFHATGTWCSATSRRDIATAGPDGTEAIAGDFVKGKPQNALICKIGGSYYFVGSSSVVTAGEDGIVELRMNDSGLTDNDGSLTVLCQVNPKP
jgi:hypothetical protein